MTCTHRALLTGAALTLASLACDDAAGGGSAWKLNMRLLDRPSVPTGARVLDHHLGAGVRGIYFGRVGILALDYRPGEALNYGADEDWSIVASALPGAPSADSRLLEDAGTLDLSPPPGTLDAIPHPGPDHPFVKEVGALDIDLAMVSLGDMGLLYDLEGAGRVEDYHYFGARADRNGFDQHPLWRYPQYAAVQDSYVAPVLPDWTRWLPTPTNELEGGAALTTHYVFARKDWFPEPRLVVIEGVPGSTGLAVGFDSGEREGAPLSEFQREVVLSLGRGPAGPGVYLFFPEERARIVYRSDAPALSEDPLPGREFEAANFSMDVIFDITNSVNWRYTNLTPAEFEPNPPPGDQRYGYQLIEVTRVEAGEYSMDFAGQTVRYTASAEDTAASIAQGLVNAATAVLQDVPERDRRYLRPPQELPDGKLGLVDIRVPAPFQTDDPKLSYSEKLPSPYLVFSGDADGVPFGMELLISDDAVLCPSAPFPPTTSCLEASGSRPVGCCVCPPDTKYTSAPDDDNMRICKP